MLKSIAAYETIYSLVSKSIAPDKTRSIKTLQKWRNSLDDKFIELSCDWREYKEDSKLDHLQFNETNEEGPVIKHNDAWYDQMESKYIEICEKADALLDGPIVASDKSEPKGQGIDTKNKDIRLRDMLLSQIGSETESIEQGVSKLDEEVSNTTSATLDPQKAESLLLKCSSFSDRLNNGLQGLVLQCLPLMDETDVKEKSEMHNAFLTKFRGILSNISCKIVENSVPKASASTPTTVPAVKQQTYLKKIDPPKFTGDIIDYPDFKRKWKANVGNAHLPAEGELDRLKDSIPEHAAKLLFSEKTMDSAWNVLDKMYGNKTMIASKLKNQLKAIKAVRQEDHDIVINLAIDVKTIENRLQELELETMLRYDDEYLSAVFKALPSTERLEWLKFDKSSYPFEWDALLCFLEQAREKATSTKVLLSCYAKSDDFQTSCSNCGSSSHNKSVCTVRVNAVKTTGVTSHESSSEDEGDRLRREKDVEVRKRIREQCGKCPLCKKRHTFIRRRDNREWPSDRLISCSEFQRLNAFERASLLERISGCARCTAWSHSKPDCRAPTFKCGLTRNGSVCQADHSRLVCGSGVAYCANIKVSSSSDQNSPSSTLPLDCETLLAFQRVKFGGITGMQLACFDNGSNRCLIQNEFALKNKLRSQKIRYRIKAVGVPERVEEANIFMFELQDKNNKSTCVWAYGIDHIMPPPLILICHRFESYSPMSQSELFLHTTLEKLFFLLVAIFSVYIPLGVKGPMLSVIFVL